MDRINFSSIVANWEPSSPSMAGKSSHPSTTDYQFRSICSRPVGIATSGDASYHADMLLGQPYIGKAIAILREPFFSQKELAAALGIENGTMNKYERGKQPVPEGVLRKIAQLIKRELIDILDTAYEIFRFNYCLEESQRTGEDLEVVIARHNSRVKIEEIHAARASFLDKFDEWERKKTEFEGQQRIEGFSVLRYVVEREKRGTRKKTAKSQPSQETPKR